MDNILKNFLLTKSIRICSFCAAFTFLSPSLIAQQTNFSGNWIRNTDKCDAGDLSINSIPIKINVGQSDKEIQITRISKNVYNDTTNYTEKLKFDGTSATSIIRSNVNKKASMQWSPDQKRFTENAAYAEDQGNPKQNSKEIWALMDDGKTLQIVLTLTLNGQDHPLTEIFYKQ
jgi:hypothetical protein